jgi:hypothetical protein
MDAISPDHLNPTGDFWNCMDDRRGYVDGRKEIHDIWTMLSTIIAFLTISDRDRLPSPEFP